MGGVMVYLVSAINRYYLPLTFAGRELAEVSWHSMTGPCGVYELSSVSSWPTSSQPPVKVWKKHYKLFFIYIQ